MRKLKIDNTFIKKMKHEIIKWSPYLSLSEESIIKDTINTFIRITGYKNIKYNKKDNTINFNSNELAYYFLKHLNYSENEISKIERKNKLNKINEYEPKKR